MKRWLLFCGCYAALGWLLAQDFFVRPLDNGGDETAGDLLLVDSQLVVAGFTTGAARDRSDGLIHYLDLNGSWHRSLRTRSDRRNRFAALGQSSTDGAIVVGGWLNTESTIDDAVLYWLSPAGEVVRSLGSGITADDEQIRTLQPLNDGDLLILGNIGTSNEALLWRIAPDGTTRWRRTLRHDSAGFGIVNSAVEVADGIFVAGSLFTEGRNAHTMVAKLSAEGDLCWSYVYESPGQAWGAPRSILATAADELLLVSQRANTTGNLEPLLMRIDTVGNLRSASVLAGLNDNVLRAATYTDRGGLLLIGSQRRGEGQTAGLVVELSGAGSLVGQRLLGESFDTRLSAVARSSGGGYYFAGTGNSCLSDNQDILLFYLDEELRNGKEMTPPTSAALQLENLALPTKIESGKWSVREEPERAPSPLFTTTTLTDADFAIDPPSAHSVETCLGDSLTVNLSTPGAAVYRWADGAVGPRRAFSTAGQYIIELSNACNAIETELAVSTTSCCRVYLPSAFSPNFDGINDVFRAEMGGESCNRLRDWRLQVFDRWGGEVFSGKEPSMGWSGSDFPGGSYFYRLAYREGAEIRQDKGLVTLVR